VDLLFKSSELRMETETETNIAQVEVTSDNSDGFDLLLSSDCS